jgi:P27 family predicted phage terminase small subunit
VTHEKKQHGKKAAGMVPRPPSRLNLDAREHWLKLAPWLHSRGLLTSLDLRMFELLCSYWEMMQSLKRAIDEHGSDETLKRSLTVELEKAQRIYDELCKEFGLPQGPSGS